MTIAQQPARRAFDLALSDRDVDLIETLTRRLRVLTLCQVARTWWPGADQPIAAARHRAGQLQQAGYLAVFIAMAHPEIPLTSPVISWAPGHPMPDCGTASHRLRSRWGQHAVATHCVFATSRAGSQFGGYGGRRPRETEETHDIHLAQVYLLLKKQNPEAARFWVSEEAIRRRRKRQKEKLPDALIEAPNSHRVVEFGGAYSKAKLTMFHRYCAEELQIPYEVW